MMRSVWAPKPQRSGLTPVKRHMQRESGGTFAGKLIFPEKCLCFSKG